MACHTPPLSKAKKKEEKLSPILCPIPSLNSILMHDGTEDG